MFEIRTDRPTVQTQDKYLIAMLSLLFNRADEIDLTATAQALTSQQWTGARTRDFCSFFQASQFE